MPHCLSSSLGLLTVKNKSLLFSFFGCSHRDVAKEWSVGQFTEVSAPLSMLDISKDSAGAPSGGPLGSILRWRIALARSVVLSSTPVLQSHSPVQTYTREYKGEIDRPWGPWHQVALTATRDPRCCGNDAGSGRHRVRDRKQVFVVRTSVILNSHEKTRQLRHIGFEVDAPMTRWCTCYWWLQQHWPVNSRRCRSRIAID